MKKGMMMVALGLVLAACGKSNSSIQPTPGPTMGAEEKANRFLAGQGITLPPGVKRVNLEAKSGGSDSGVMTEEKRNGTTTYSVIADLPDPGSGVYGVWLEGGEGAAVKLGNLIPQKGGYMVDYSTSKDYSQYNRIIISRDTGTLKVPGEVMLEGRLGQ